MSPSRCCYPGAPRCFRLEHEVHEVIRGQSLRKGVTLGRSPLSERVSAWEDTSGQLPRVSGHIDRLDGDQSSSESSIRNFSGLIKAVATVSGK